MKNSIRIRKITPFLPLFLLFLGACSSVTKGTTQEVFVETQDVKEAKCTLKNTKGEWIVASTPGYATVGRGGGALNVHCEKEKFEPATKLVSQGFEAMTLGNVLIGGLIGIAVDAASGAAFNYPDNISVLMRPINPIKKNEQTFSSDKIARLTEAKAPKDVKPELKEEVTVKPYIPAAKSFEKTKPVKEIEAKQDINPTAKRLAGNWRGFAGTGCINTSGSPVILKIGAQVKSGSFKLFIHRETGWGTVNRRYFGNKVISQSNIIVYQLYTAADETIVNFSNERDAIFMKFSPSCEIRLKRTQKNTIPEEYV